MANIKFKRAILAVLLVMCTMFCFIGSASMASAQADQTGQQEDIITYFLNNRELAWLIDELAKQQNGARSNPFASPRKDALTYSTSSLYCQTTR